jgi:hypothetical protein
LPSSRFKKILAVLSIAESCSAVSGGHGYSQGSGVKRSFGVSLTPDIQTPITPTASLNTSDPLNGGKYTVRAGFRDTRKNGTGLGFGTIWGFPPKAN